MADEIYGSVDDSRAYNTARNVGGDRDAWINESDDATLATILLRATEFIDGRYGAMFPGYKVGLRAQIREWPRNNAADRNGDQISPTEIPIEVIHATYEAALIEQKTPGTLNPNVNYSQRRQSVEVVGAVAVTYASLPLRAEAYRTIMTIVDQILAGILGGRGATSSLSGSAYRV